MVGSEVGHVGERLRVQSDIRYDPGVVNKKTDSNNIDFVWISTTNHLRASFMALIKKEFKLRGWDARDPVTGTVLATRNKISKLKCSLLGGVKVTILKNSLNRVAEKRDKFLFPMDFFLLCILHMEN